MKLILAAGTEENCSQIENILKSVNAACRGYYLLNQLLEEARQQTCHLFVIAFETRIKSENAVQQIKKESALRSVPVIVYFPAGTSDSASRGRMAGANDCLLLPVKRQELL